MVFRSSVCLSVLSPLTTGQNVTRPAYISVRLLRGWIYLFCSASWCVHRLDSDVTAWTFFRAIRQWRSALRVCLHQRPRLADICPCSSRQKGRLPFSDLQEDRHYTNPRPYSRRLYSSPHAWPIPVQLEFRRDFWHQKTRVPGLPYGVVVLWFQV